MQINLSSNIRDRKGVILKLDPESSQLGDFLYHATSQALPTDATDVASRRKLTSLMNKVACGGVVELSTEEAAILTTRCAAFFAPMFFAPIDEILNPPAEA